MNASLSNYGDQEFYYGSPGDPDRKGSPSQARRSKHSAKRRAKSPTQHNGIHRRRRKRITW